MKSRVWPTFFVERRRAKGGIQRSTVLRPSERDPFFLMPNCNFGNSYKSSGTRLPVLELIVLGTIWRGPSSRVARLSALVTSSIASGTRLWLMSRFALLAHHAQGVVTATSQVESLRMAPRTLIWSGLA